jgi:H+-transporting ATPase
MKNNSLSRKLKDFISLGLHIMMIEGYKNHFMLTAVKSKKSSEYKETSIEDTLGGLDTSMKGLASSEVSDRIQNYGYNEVEEKRKNPFLQFFRRYWGPMPWLLEVAIILAYFLGHYLESGIILALLTMNAVIGYFQERGSQKALESLKKRLAIKAKVLRDGLWITIEAREIVPGDIIALALGDVVPADTKIISGEFSIDQSILTGESMPVDARQSSVVYAGSVVKRGEGQGAVINTSTNTFFGQTAELVKIAHPKSHQEEIMLAIVRYMLYFGLAALVLVAIYSVLIGIGVLSIVTFAVIFLMAAVPVALPAVMTIVQSVGATEMVKKGVLVTRLDSIEDAASIDVLCLDKTGTITENKLSVADIIFFPGYTREDVILISILASQEVGNDTIDMAVIAYAKSSGIESLKYQRLSFTPFEPSTKRSEAIIQTDGRKFKVTKGAPQIIVSICSGIDEEFKKKIDQLVEDLSRKGYRTLGVARSEGEGQNNLHLVGLLSLADPPRSDSKQMIEEMKGLGIRPVMLTGDNIAIAREIAKQVLIGEKIVQISKLKGLSEAEQAKAIEEYDGFAEIYPEDKYKIVKLLQSRKHIVGMTGDGVNDAPALKQAELGIAVSNATDVAKASASVVITEPGIRVIVEAIKTSRHIYQRMLTWVINKVTKVIQVIGLLTIGFFWVQDTVVSLLGMALLIFANDFVTMSLATDNVKFTSNPNKWNVRNITLASLVIGLLLIAEGTIALWIGKNYFHLGIDELRTFMILLLIFTSQFRIYIVRERRYFWSSLPGKALIIATVAALVVFTLMGIYGLIVTPLAVYQVLFVLGFSALFTFAIDVPKYLAFRRFGL